MSKKEFIPIKMTVQDFCNKWGFKDITTSKMNGIRLSNGKMIIGSTIRNELAHPILRKDGKKHNGMGGIINAWALCPDYNIAKDWKVRIEYMLGYLDQFPRKQMI